MHHQVNKNSNTEKELLFERQSQREKSDLSSDSFLKWLRQPELGHTQARRQEL